MPVLTTSEIALEWRGKVYSGAYWRRSFNTAGGPVGAPKKGESGGYKADCDEYPRRVGYMKPGIPDPNPRHARAAREKIASDLAHDLGVAVPPVILATQREANYEPNVCVSLVMQPYAYSWAEIVQKLQGSRPPPKAKEVVELIDKARAALPLAAAHALAFDTWVAQMDHHENNNHNIVLGYETEVVGKVGHKPAKRVKTCGYILLDYALAFGISGRWQDPANDEYWSKCRPSPLHPHMLGNVDRDELSRMIARIEAVSHSTIDQVVRRIPASHLPDEEKEVIVAGLKGRQPLLRGALDPYLPKEPPR